MKTMLLVIKFLISSMGRVTFSTYLHITEQGREYICCMTDSEPRKALRAWSNGLQGNTSSRVKLNSSPNTALHSSQKQLCKTRWGDVASAHGAEILGIQTWVGTSAWVKSVPTCLVCLKSHTAYAEGGEGQDFALAFTAQMGPWVMFGWIPHSQGKWKNEINQEEETETMSQKATAEETVVI